MAMTRLVRSASGSNSSKSDPAARVSRRRRGALSRLRTARSCRNGRLALHTLRRAMAACRCGQLALDWAVEHGMPGQLAAVRTR